MLTKQDLLKMRHNEEEKMLTAKKVWDKKGHPKNLKSVRYFFRGNQLDTLNVVNNIKAAVV